ncbi:ATP-binding cassette domain-containing protein [Paenibacillus luteus]|uniref:ATP-binding cassette domain-containing protein n=1 Tax=Paenibacillus luteus TaxID=2545753 RepID=UPI001143E00F|nr:ATP-binding cassette domain-containing protein [Paenibacillus luteus]
MGADWKLSSVDVYAQSGAAQKQLLHEVNHTFKAGQITLLVGRNGAGKSTLLETMTGLHSIHKGSIMMGNESLWIKRGRKERLNPEVTMKLGLAMQNAQSQWFAASVLEELRYSLKPYQVSGEAAEARMERALNEAGLPPEMLTQDPWTLSGGQQRRLSLACLLACEPEWLLLDEPTAGLDAVGIQRLCAVLAAHRASGRGAVVATHDLDALLPLADAVAVVSGGTVRAAAPAAAMKHAAAAPQALRVLAELHAEAALPLLAQERSGGAPWPAPSEVAAALALALERRSAEHKLLEAEQLSVAVHKAIQAAGPNDSSRSKQMMLAEEEAANVSEMPKEAISQTSGLQSTRFDPRALILSYLVLAASIFMQQSGLGLLLAGLATVLLLIPFRAFIRPWIGILRAYAIMIMIFCVVGGIGLEPLSFDSEKAWPIVLRFGKLFLIMMLGMPLLNLMTPYRLQRAIEQTFGWLGKLGVPIHSFALIVTLIFRFIPLLTGEWERFAKLAHARGKADTPLRKVPLKNVHAVLIPYVRSILRLAEQMSDALEARGFGYKKGKPVYAFRLRFDRSDAWLLGIAGGCGLGLIIIRSLL